MSPLHAGRDCQRAALRQELNLATESTVSDFRRSPPCTPGLLSASMQRVLTREKQHYCPFLPKILKDYTLQQHEREETAGNRVRAWPEAQETPRGTRAPPYH